MRLLLGLWLGCSAASALELPPPATQPGRAVRVWRDAVPGGLSVRRQFVDPKAPEQGADMDSCHVFVAVALLEGALYRQHGAAIKLSEADLFLRYTALRDPRRYDAFMAEGIPSVDDTGEPSDDVDFALKDGVATGLDYAQFRERYLRHRRREEQTLEALAFATEAEIDKWLAGKSEAEGRLEVERLLSGGADLSASRADVREHMAGFKPARQKFEAAPGLSGAKCLEASAPQRAFLARELRAERPVGACSRKHCFTLVDLLVRADGGLSFGVRDSLDPDRAPLRDDELCEVYDALSVRAPVDRP